MANKRQEQAVIGRTRLSYAHLFKPHAFVAGGEENYSVVLLIDKKDKNYLAEIERAIEGGKQVGIEKGKWNSNVAKTIASPLHDGDNEFDNDGNPKYPGCYYLNTKSKTKPAIVDLDKNEIFNESEVYSGCYAKAVVTFFPYSFAGKKGLTTYINIVQKIEDGEPLGGGASLSLLDDDSDLL